jgi:glycosyltransferase involved in cell wall biosynthesis/uncharacterized membrane protein
VIRVRAAPLDAKGSTTGAHPQAVAGRRSMIVSLALLSLFVLALIAFRIAYTHTSVHIAIAWNLFLAWIPLVAALIATNRPRTAGLAPGFAAAVAIWLIFLPNAPYMITDLKYAGYSDDVPVLYDVLLLAAAAWTGLVLGLASLLLIHAIARRRIGSIKAWLLVVAVLAVCSFGIYLGRVERLNSWDIFVRPLALAHAASGAALHLRPLALTILFTCFLVGTYLVLYSFATRPQWFSAQLQPPADDDQNGNTTRPRLMFVITLAEHGGAQTYLSLLLPAVANRFDVTVAAHGPGPLEDAARVAGVRFVPLEHVRRAIAPVHDVLGLVELIRLFRGERPDIVHANSSKAGVLGRLAAFVAGVPVRIFTVHGWAFAAYDGFAGRLYLWADRVVRPLTTLVICVSHRERELGLRTRACASERSVVVHNAVDLRAFRVAATRGESPQIISVGRFAYPKDHVTLVRAMASVESDFRAIFVGEGPDQPALANEVRRLGLAPNVALLGARSDVPDLLAGADVFVLSSRSEGLPMSVLEAMAAGLPVVATDVGGVSELVLEGETGLLVPRGDTTALAQALERLLRDEDLRRRMAASARARVEREFDLTSFQEAHVELYRRELERRGLPLPGLDQDAADGEPRRLRAVGQRSSGTRRIGPSASQ